MALKMPHRARNVLLYVPNIIGQYYLFSFLLVLLKLELSHVDPCVPELSNLSH